MVLLLDGHCTLFLVLVLFLFRGRSTRFRFTPRPHRTLEQGLADLSAHTAIVIGLTLLLNIKPHFRRSHTAMYGNLFVFR